MTIVPDLAAVSVILMVADLRSEDVLEWVLYLCALSVVGFAALIWAAFLRKGKRRRKRVHKPHTWQKDAESESGSGHHRRSGRHRHSRPEEPHRNPTLAESGGLPPIRPDEPGNPPEP